MRDYIQKLSERGELHVVERQVDPRFELAAVVGRSQQESDFPVLFRNVKGTAMPVISNVFGSHARLCEIIGTTRGNFCRHWQAMVDDGPGPGRAGACEGAVEEERIQGKISELPHVTYFEHDAGPYITAGVFLAKEPETGVPNLSFSRAMMVSDDELRVRLAPPHDLTRYQEKAEAKKPAAGSGDIAWSPAGSVHGSLCIGSY